MIYSGREFRWMKIKNGRLHLAVVNLNIQKNGTGNKIIENYPEGKICNNSIDVGINGFEDWKIALKAGLKFAASFSQDFWTITINEVSGKPFMDTIPTIVGYTGILAFIEQANVVISNEIIQEIEEFVYSSWYNGNEKKIPDFNELIFK
ncbi:MAG: hypothetical protein ABWY22_05760 [Flavobacterium sp.]